MSKKPSVTPDQAKNIAWYLQPVDLHTLLPINVGLRSAQEATMISVLGSPQLPLTTVDQPGKASPLVKKLASTLNISPLIIANGIKPSVQSLDAILKKAFSQEQAAGHDLKSVLSSAYNMLNVRYRKPPKGPPSTQISNHAWGTAIDFKIITQDFLGDTHSTIPKYIEVLLPLFNEAGWYSGISFHDTMHFEVSDGTIHQWSAEGKFKI
jgi:hypothetical protein